MGDCFAQQIAADHGRYDLDGDVSVVARPRKRPYLDNDQAQVLLDQFSDEEEERLRYARGTRRALVGARGRRVR